MNADQGLSSAPKAAQPFIVDRVNASRALAKCIAYLAVGKRDDAEYWFRQLARELGFAPDQVAFQRIRDRIREV
jgi:hypothetical protein